MFIAEILEEHYLPIEKIIISTEELIDFELLHFSAQAPEIEKAEEDFVNDLEEDDC